MSFFDRKKKENDDNYSDLNNPSYQNPQPDQNNFDQAQNQYNDAQMNNGTQFGGNDFNQPSQAAQPGSNDYFFGQNQPQMQPDRKSTRLNSSHVSSSYAVFCLKQN